MSSLVRAIARVYGLDIWEASGMGLDRADRALLDTLQRDATPTMQQLAAAVGLSTNACWRRIKHFEERGYITGRVAILDPAKIGVGTTVFASVRAAEHSTEWLEGFAEAVKSVPEVVEFYRMAGDIDYLIKFRVADISAYDKVYKMLITKTKIENISAAFAMEELKNSTVITFPTPEELSD